MKLGKKILELRKKKGLSQEELGERINVTRQTISNWELGETSPNIEQLKNLSKELNISIDDLLDNDIQNVLVEKVSNTEKTTKKSFVVLKMIAISICLFIVLFLVLVIGKIISKNIQDKGMKRYETIHCSLYGEEHSFGITYYELDGIPRELGGDPYFSDILDLGKYNDAHQIFNIINDYVKKNGGTCNIIEERNLNYIIDFYLKEGSLTNTKATFIVKNTEKYDITFGEAFYLEKYNYETNSFEKLSVNTKNNCAFNDIGYILDKKEREIEQDWSCVYGKLDKGLYRIVKDVSFDSDRPIDENNMYYISTEFEID